MKSHYLPACMIMPKKDLTNQTDKGQEKTLVYLIGANGGMEKTNFFHFLNGKDPLSCKSTIGVDFIKLNQNQPPTLIWCGGENERYNKIGYNYIRGADYVLVFRKRPRACPLAVT
jgi:hypothetical protein